MSKETSTKTDKNLNNYVAINFSTDPESCSSSLKKFANIINELLEEPVIKITQRNIISIIKEISSQINDFCISEEFISSKKFSKVFIFGPVIPEDDKEEYSLNSSCYIVSESGSTKEIVGVSLEDDSYKGKKGGKIVVQFDIISNKEFKTHLNKLVPDKNNPLYTKINKICQDNNIYVNYVYYDKVCIDENEK